MAQRFSGLTENRNRTAFRRALLTWYRRHRRDLPWRRTRDPYRIFVSEVMLQQTQAATVIPYYQRFLKEFPTAQALARAPRDRVMKLWEGLGYYARARNLIAAARRIVRLHNGRIPRDPGTFSSLPGAGPYTTAAVMSIAYGIPLAAVDGNVKRVISRLYDIGRIIKPNDKEVQARAQTLMEGNGPTAGLTSDEISIFNQAMMELGAVVCTPKMPACLICPVRRHCAAFKNGTVDRRPVAPKRRTRPHVRVVAAILSRNGKVLIGRRPDHGLLGGLWEFPGGKVERGESAEEALRRELKEELGVDVEVGPAIAEVDHGYTHFSVTLSGHVCRLMGGNPKPRVHSALRWVEWSKVNRFAMPEANRKLLIAAGILNERFQRSALSHRPILFEPKADS